MTVHPEEQSTVSANAELPEIAKKKVAINNRFTITTSPIFT